ncbi:MAG: hypothetical protein ACK5QT_03875 [Oligoflexia bacterium]
MRYLPRLKTLLIATLVSTLPGTLPSSHALSVSSFGLSGGISSPMGYQYQAFSQGWHVAGELALSGLEFNPQLEPVFAFSYQDYNLRTVQTAGYHVSTVGFGLIAYGSAPSPKTGRTGIQPFFGTIVGAAVDWLTFNSTQLNPNASIGGSVQIQTGLSFTIGNSFELRAMSTLQGLFFTRSLFVFQPALGLRWRL